MSKKLNWNGGQSEIEQIYDVQSAEKSSSEQAPLRSRGLRAPLFICCSQRYGELFFYLYYYDVQLENMDIMRTTCMLILTFTAHT